MRSRLGHVLCALAPLALLLALTTPAHAVKPVAQGSMRLSAERLVAIGVSINADANFYLQALPGPGDVALQYPRAGFDYFIIDGLSLGGSAGFTFFSLGDSVGWGIIPRVGYAFDLTRKLEFWPRGGIGGFGVDSFAGATSTAVLQFEGIFSLEMVPHALFQFGPAIDVALASGWPVDIGGVAGIAIDF